MAMRLFHRALASTLFLLAPGPVRAQSPDNPPTQQQKSSDPSAKQEPSLSKTKKIWTNDNLSSVPGQVSVVDAPGSSVGRGSRSSSSYSNGATFLTPAAGQVVHPGEIVHFDLSVDPGRSSGPVSLVSPLGFSREYRESAPYSFTLEIPRAEDQVGGGGPLIGTHPVTAFGKVPGKKEWGLGAIEVDVEENEMPVSLSVTSSGAPYGPSGLRFFNAGEEKPLRIYATFPSGEIRDVTNSNYLNLASADPKVVRVREEGGLTSFGPGATSVTVTYSLGAQTVQITIPAAVIISNSAIVLTPLSLDFGDQQVGSKNSTLQVTLTNHSFGEIKVFKLEVRAPVRESDDCTSGPLQPGGNCTISITFTPSRAGPNQGVIYIPNSHSGMLSLPISGNGI
jgi:hypothetical protein